MICPVDKCGKLIAGEMLLCRPHWFSVPPELRNRIWALYRRQQGSDEHRAACFQAIEIANAKAQRAHGPVEAHR